MKEIKIEVPEGYEIDKDQSTPFCIKLKQVEKKNLRWLDIQKKNIGKSQFYLDEVSNVCKNALISEGVTCSQTNVPTQREAEKIRALCQLLIIQEHYNEGWEPDWENMDQYKFYPMWSLESNNIDWGISAILIGSIIAFKSKEVMFKAYEANKEIFETALKP